MLGYYYPTNLTLRMGMHSSIGKQSSYVVRAATAILRTKRADDMRICAFNRRSTYNRHEPALSGMMDGCLDISRKGLMGIVVRQRER